MDETRTILVETLPAGEPQPVEIPARIGTVRLGHEIGRGSGGVVFAGFDDALSRPVAVKVLRRLIGEGPDPATIELVEGLRSAARIKHPHMVTIYAVHTDAGVPVVVMEYVDGGSLRELLRRGGALPVELAVYVLRCVLEAVDALHREGVIHRDLKPANILFDRQGRPYVCDFGMACELEALERGELLGAVGGSPLYMAPEMFEGRASLQSDVYALGVILFEMLAGRPPFEAGSLDEMKARHIAEPVPLEVLAARGVPERLREVVRRAMHKQAILRYKSAGHLLRAVSEAAPPMRAADVLREALTRRIVGEARGREVARGSAPAARTIHDLVARRAAEKRRRR